MNRKPFNGHRSWNAWNISLWIGNDEGLYRFALECLERHDQRKIPAAEEFLSAMQESGSLKTPDGAPWTVTNIARAMCGLG